MLIIMNFIDNWSKGKRILTFLPKSMFYRKGTQFRQAEARNMAEQQVKVKMTALYTLALVQLLVLVSGAVFL